MPSAPRYFRNDAELSSRNAYKQLVSSLERLVISHSPDAVPIGGGLYDGPISIAFLFFALQELYPDLMIEKATMATWFAVYLKQAQDAIRHYPAPQASSCGVGDDILALLALGAASAKESDMARELCDFAAVTLHAEADNDWLHGRAGYLYLLRLVKVSFIDDADIIELIVDTADEVIDSILSAPRPWKWAGKAYIGPVHGAIGIITQIVLTEPTYAAQLEPELGALLSYQLPGGNFPSSVPPTRDRLVQFCHGAPGIVASLLSIRRYFPALRTRIDEAVRLAREAILVRGLLTKEPCLCHGVSGNALALKDAEFRHFLSYTTRAEVRTMEKDGMMEKSSRPAGLWCGEAGRAWAWAVADQDLDRRFLGYNDI